jgi:hypothetical protein
MAIAALPQDSIEVDVEFYDETEGAKLIAYPTGKLISGIVEHGLVVVPVAEFLTYYLFHRKRLGTPGYRDYHSIGKKLHVALASLDECVEFNGKSMSTGSATGRQLNEVSEHIGEGIGLAIASRLHGLTEADWSPIQEQRGQFASPTFDFQIASDGERFI